MRIDFYLAAVAGSRRWYFNWALTIVSLTFDMLTISGSRPIVVTGISLTAVSTVMWLTDWHAHRAESREMHTMTVAPTFGGLRIPHGKIVRFPKIGSVKSDLNRDAAKAARNDVAATWPAVDSALSGSLANFRWSPLRKPLNRTLRKYSSWILTQQYREAKPGSALFNGRLVRQDDDLDADALTRNIPVRLSATRYFSLVASNYLVEKNVEDRHGKIIIQGASLIRTSTGRLDELAESRLANVIGVSTLAFSRDRRAIVVRQSDKSISNALRWAPGSGSMEMTDVRAIRRGASRTIVEVVASAMERELAEEAHLELEDIERTHVLGYFRWLNKGAKPEYVGVTTLTEGAEAYEDRNVRLTEASYVRAIDSCEINFDRLIANPDDIAAIMDEHIRVHASMPLYMCLRALGIRLRTDPDFRHTFLESVSTSDLDNVRPSQI